MKFDANAIFEDELARRGMSFVRDNDQEYRIQVGDLEVLANLINVRRNAERDDDPGVITRFVDHVLDQHADPPAWAAASTNLFLSAERADQEFGDTIRALVTDDVSRVVTLTDRAQTRVTWVTSKMCAAWNVTPEEATAAALANQDKLLDGISLQLAEAQGRRLGMVPLDSPYKASVIFAGRFKDLVQAAFGWPVLVVIPCRDFIYVVEEASSLLESMGQVVVEEFLNSGYPLTTEVLRVSDDGIEAIGHFPTEA